MNLEIGHPHDSLIWRKTVKREVMSWQQWCNLTYSRAVSNRWLYSISYLRHWHHYGMVGDFPFWLTATSPQSAIGPPSLRKG